MTERRMLSFLFGTLLATGTWAAAPSPYYPQDIPRLQKADFIFFPSSVVPATTDTQAAAKRTAQLDYIKEFRVCLTNGYKNFEGSELQDLRKAGCEVFIYRWFDGFYESELPGAPSAPGQTDYYSQYPEMLATHAELFKHKDWFLNPDKPMKGAGAVHPAYFFDFTNAALRAFLVERIKRDLTNAQYPGIFFDYIGGWALPDEVKAMSRQKHPDMPYDKAGLLFLKDLRAAMPDLLIFGNQAYRLGPEYYDVIDYDATESHHTSFVWGKELELYIKGKGKLKLTDTFYRMWDKYPDVSKERRQVSVARPNVKVFDINYLQPMRIPTGESLEVGDMRQPMFAERTDRPAIFYSYAMSKLENGYPYASDWYAEGFGRDDVYFLDLGESLNKDYIETPGAVVRYFKNGFVVVTRSSTPTNFKPDPQFVPADKGLFDLFEGTPVFDWATEKEVAIYPTYYPSSQSYYPAGRVFVYTTAGTPQAGK